MAVHILKCEEEYFEAQRKKLKNFEIRRDDREPAFEVGDLIILDEVKTAIDGTVWPTGRSLAREITYVLREFEGLEPGYCAIGTKK